MKEVDVHEVEARLFELLAEVETSKRSIVICRDGAPIADLIPHSPVDRSKPDGVLGRINIKFSPEEEMPFDQWPSELR